MEKFPTQIAMKTLRGPRSGRSRSQDWQIEQLPGLSTDDQVRLENCGITTTLQLCEQTATSTKRAELANQLAIHIQHVNKWAALADLARIPGVGCHYCGLLLHAGISSPAQLAQTPLPHLHRQVLRLQVAMMQRQDLCPSLEEIKQWIEQARYLERTRSQAATGMKH